MAKEQNKQISYHLYSDISQADKASLVHNDRTDKTLAKLLNKSKDFTHYNRFNKPPFQRI